MLSKTFMHTRMKWGRDETPPPHPPWKIQIYEMHIVKFPKRGLPTHPGKQK